MRVVHVVRQYPPGLGGLEEFVDRLTQIQARAGHDVQVVTLDRIFAEPSLRLAKSESRDGVAVARIPFVGSRRYPIAPTALRAVRGADLVHVHAIDFFFDFLAATRFLHRRKLVATTHGGFFHSGAHARLKRAWFDKATRLSARAYGAVVACSAADFALFSSIGAPRLRLIENGVDVEKFADMAAKLPRKRLVALGRFSLNKRLDRLLDAAAALARLDPEWRLDLIGAESDWTGARLGGEIARRRLDGVVALHVQPDNREIGAIIGAASIFVSASEYEGFGISLVEALSAGLSPVVEANAAFAEFAAKGPEVALTDYANPEGAAQAIVAAYARLAADCAGVRVAAMRAAAPYAWSGVAARYQSLYEDVLAN